MQARVIAVVNQKGGSGKTTTAVSLAAALGEAGNRVLTVDLDPQGSATRWLGGDELDDRLLDVFERDRPLADLAEPASSERVALVPASPNLLDTRLAQAVDPHHALVRGLAGLRDFDHVVLDCPPALGHVVVAALAASDDAFIPVAAHAMELDGLAAVHRTVDVVARRMRPQLRRRVLACRVDGRTRLAREVVGTLRSRLPGEMLDTVVRENVRLAEAPSHRLPITTYAPASRGARDYRAVAAELTGRAPADG